MIKYYTKKEYQTIADSYDLGKIKQMSKLYVGYGGSAKVSVATILGKFVISKNIISKGKGIVGKTKVSLQYEIDMLQTVKGMPVPTFLLSKKKTFVTKFQDGLVTVYPFIDGKAPSKVTPTMAYQLGQFFGEFHKTSQKFKKELKERRKYYDLSPAVMKKMRPYVYKQTNPILQNVIQKVEQGVQDNMPPAGLPRGPIHVDPCAKNQLFQGKKLTGIIDFGNFYIGPFMVDVGKIIMFNCCPKKLIDKKLLEKVVAGYNNKRKFTVLEKKYLKKAILYAIYSHIWVDLYHLPKEYVPESYVLFLVKKFLGVAEDLEKGSL